MTLADTTAASERNIVPGATLYRVLVQNSLDGLMLTAPDGSIFDANPAAVARIGPNAGRDTAGGRQGLIDASDSATGGTGGGTITHGQSSRTTQSATQ